MTTQTQNNQKQSVHERVTESIIKFLEQPEPWKKPWIVQTQFGIAGQFNAVTRKAYNGINQILLSISSIGKKSTYSSWMTMNQANKLGAKIRKGSKATMVVYSDFLYLDSNDKALPSKMVQAMSDDQLKQFKKVYFEKPYWVFNVAEIDDLPSEYYMLDSLPTLPDHEREFRAQQIVEATGAKLIHRGNRAYYDLLKDHIVLPPKKQFLSENGYTSTAFHELTHWTGAADRLNRDLVPFEVDETKYALEELVAELGAAFLCAEIGYSRNISQNSAYIASWLKHLRDDKYFIFKAAAKASIASNYVKKLLPENFEFAAVPELEAAE